MDLITNRLESQIVYRQMRKTNVGGCVGKVVLKHLKEFSKLRHTYMSHARRRINQLRTSGLQPPFAKPLAAIRSKVVPSLSWSGVVTKMAYGPGETAMRAICWRHLRTAIRNVLQKTKKSLSKVRRLIKKFYVRVFGQFTDTQDINELEFNVTHYVKC